MFKALFRVGFVGIGFVALSLGTTGCESGSHASKGAQQGAVTGATAGAVGGLVSALVFGGDPVDRAARGAVYGGTTGAVAGGMSGSRRDKAEKQAKTQTREAQVAEYKEKVGPDAYAGTVALAECRHDDVVLHADKAMQSENPNFALAGLWLEVLAYADQKNESEARALFPTLVEKDWRSRMKTRPKKLCEKLLTTS